MEEQPYKFPKLGIENVDTPVVFKFQFRRGEKDFFISYHSEDHKGYEDHFNDFADFFYRLHLHYNSRIEQVKDSDSKRYILEEYNKTVIESQITLCRWFPKLEKEIEEQIVKYERYIEIEKEQLLLRRPKSQKAFTDKQKVLILEYLGFFKMLEGSNLKEKQTAELVSSITDIHFDNARKYIRNRHRPVAKGIDVPKTRTNLDKLLSIFNEIGLGALYTNKIQEDINSVK